MGKNQRKAFRKIYQMKTIQIGNRNTIEPIAWEPYKGETVIVKTVIKGGKKIQEKEYFEDKVKAIPQGNAYIIGNGPSRKSFDLESLRSTGQTYGCNAIYRDFKPDFLFSVDAKMSREIADSKIWEQVTCYAPSLEVNRNKGLHLIPMNPHYTSGNTAIHTSIIHGHKNVYLLGFDFREYGKDKFNNIYQGTENYGERHSDQIFDAWLTSFRRQIKERPYVKFTIVHDNPPEYLNHLQTGTDLDNTQIISYSEFTDSVLGGRS
jgi:hypothetical protein